MHFSKIPKNSKKIPKNSKKKNQKMKTFWKKKKIGIDYHE